MQEVKEYLDYYNEKKKISKFTKFLWWAAGADSQILSQCPMADRVKYAGIGGIVFCTGLLASVSGGYAFYTIFGPKTNAVNIDPVSIPAVLGSMLFGLIWGLIILNMDRFIVSSTGKGDGTDKITLGEFGQAIPRIIIAIILGLAISAPIEVRILQTEINAKLQEKQDEYLERLNASTELNITQKMKSKKIELNKVENEITHIETTFEKRRIEIKEQRRLLELEAEGKTASRSPGRGPAYRDKKENLDKMEIELNEKKKAKQPEIIALKARLKKFQTQLDDIEKSRDKAFERNELQSHQLDGLMKRIEISHEIGFGVTTVIFLVLLSIEAGPIFFKMMMSKGVYEYMVDNYKRRIEAYNGIVHREEIIEGKDGSIHAEKIDYLEVDKEIDAKKRLITKEKALNDQIIENWSKKKTDDIANNPDEYYSEG